MTSCARSGRDAATGFTLMELLVTAAIIALVASMLAPALGRARDRARAAGCVNNARQLQAAWTLYLGDHRGALPSNEAGSTGGVWRSAADSWIGAHNAPGDEDLSGIQEGLFWKHAYLRAAEVLRCPADRTRTMSGRVARARSYALNGNAAGRAQEAQRVVFHEGEIALPAEFMTFVDEAADSIDDGHFLVWSSPDDRWVNLPAGRHGGVGVWACADGHVERRGWRSPKRFTGRTGHWKRAEGEDLRDLRTLQRFVLAYQPVEKP